MAASTYERFIQLVREFRAVQSLQELLEWDQMTVMPKKGAGWRAEQCSVMAGVAHDRLTSDELGEALGSVEQNGATSDPIVAANVREMRRQYDRATKLPKALVQELARVVSEASEVWQAARKESNFAKFAPYLSRLLGLKREVADHIGWKSERYDALLDEFEPGTKSADVQTVFDQLKGELVPMVAAIKDAPRQPDTSLLERDAPAAKQEEFDRTIVQAMGFDFDSGRLDVSTHPFCLGFTPNDVRMTTRYNEKLLGQSLFGVMHETGHALYEQGLDPAHVGTPMGMFCSLGIHESQSRLWENQVGRSRPFWEHFFPKLQQAFPSFRDVALDDWHFAINVVRPSFIRVEADEVTYGLHIMLRFDIEREMLDGRLAVADVPAAWNERMEQMLGVRPPNDAQGCLQDVHWSMGIFGYFPTYQLGNLYAAQIAAAVRQALPDLDAQLARGELLPLRDWLRENIHRYGRRYSGPELVTQVTGKALSHRPFVEYLKTKYQPLYGF